MGVWRYVKNYTDARRYDNLLTDLSFGSIIIINSFANVDFDRIERWLASKIIFVPIYISKFPNLLRRKRHIFKAGPIPFAIVRANRTFDLFIYFILAFLISKVSNLFSSSGWNNWNDDNIN